MKKLGTVVMGVALLFGGSSSALDAQGFGASGHLSTLGIGGNLAYSVAPNLGLRAGISIQPWEPTREIQDVAVTASFSTPVYSAMVDLYPFAGSFHLTGGLVHFGENIRVVGTPVRDIEVNGVTYGPSEVGNVTAQLVTRQSAPYLGIGWGNPARGAFGMTIDLGVALQGEPSLNVTTDGPYANNPVFQANLDAEVASIEGDIAGFKYYPVFSVGLSFGTF